MHTSNKERKPRPEPRSRRAQSRRKRALLCFSIGLAFGAGLRASEGRAEASGLDAECVAERWAERVELRRVAGAGDPAEQSWPGQARLDLAQSTLDFFDDRPAEPGAETLTLEAEEGP